MTLNKIGNYYTLRGAAESLGLSYWTVYRYVHQSNIPTLRLGQTLLVDLADLEELDPW